jgi:hypothetical protein
MKTQSFVTKARTLGRVVVDGRISPEDYAVNLVEGVVLLETMDSELAASVAASIPGIARNAVIDTITDVLRPDYHVHELHDGGPGPSKVERERSRDIYTERIREFAAALASALREP